MISPLSSRNGRSASHGRRNCARGARARRPRARRRRLGARSSARVGRQGRHYECTEELDMEVFGIPAHDLPAILEPFGKVEPIGKSFPVYKIANIDVGLPRRESKAAPRAQGLRRRRRSVDVDRRGRPAPRLYGQRDFVGSADRRILRSLPTAAQISSEAFSRPSIRGTFGDDSLRVLRAVQFAARFEMTLDDADEDAVPRDPPRRSAARAYLGRNRKAAASRRAPVDRICARAGARRHRSAVSGIEGARRMRAGARVASRRRRVGAHAAGDRPGAAAHRRSRSRRSAHRDARRSDARFRQAGDDGVPRRPHPLDQSRGRRGRAGVRVSRSPQHPFDRRQGRPRAGARTRGAPSEAGHALQGARRAHRRRVPPPVAESQPRAARARREVRLPGPRSRQLRLLGDGLVSRARARARRRSQPAEAAAARASPARARHAARPRHGRAAETDLRKAVGWGDQDDGRRDRAGFADLVMSQRRDAETQRS